MLKRALHPNGKHIVFDPAWHTFTMVGYPRFRSVSKALEKLFPFDTEKVSQYVAEQTGVTVAEVLEEWRMAAVLGSNVHAHIEGILRGIPAPKPKELQGCESKFFAAADVALKKFLDFYEPIAVEAPICNPELNIAGLIDVIARNRKNGKLFLGDWKTSRSSDLNKFSNYHSACPTPIEHIPNTKHFRYASQVLIYGLIMRTSGYEKVFGPIDGDAVEYGVVTLALDTELPLGEEESSIKKERKDEANVLLQFKGVDPLSLLPPCSLGETSVDELLHKMILE